MNETIVINDGAILVCEECGSQSVQTLMWVNINTNEIIGGLSCEDESNNWCEVCQSHCNVTSLEIYKASEEENEE